MASGFSFRPWLYLVVMVFLTLVIVGLGMIHQFSSRLLLDLHKMDDTSVRGFLLQHIYGAVYPTLSPVNGALLSRYLNDEQKPDSPVPQLSEPYDRIVTCYSGWFNAGKVRMIHTNHPLPTDLEASIVTEITTRQQKYPKIRWITFDGSGWHNSLSFRRSGDTAYFNAIGYSNDTIATQAKSLITSALYYHPLMNSWIDTLNNYSQHPLRILEENDTIITAGKLKKHVLVKTDSFNIGSRKYRVLYYERTGEERINLLPQTISTIAIIMILLSILWTLCAVGYVTAIRKKK